MKHAVTRSVFRRKCCRTFSGVVAQRAARGFCRGKCVSIFRGLNGEDNADAHLKRQLMAHQVVLGKTKVAGEPPGSPEPFHWSTADRPLRRREQVFYAEFDGRRRKRVLLKAIGD